MVLIESRFVEQRLREEQPEIAYEKKLATLRNLRTFHEKKGKSTAELNKEICQLKANRASFDGWTLEGASTAHKTDSNVSAPIAAFASNKPQSSGTFYFSTSYSPRTAPAAAVPVAADPGGIFGSNEATASDAPSNPLPRQFGQGNAATANNAPVDDAPAVDAPPLNPPNYPNNVATYLASPRY